MPDFEEIYQTYFADVYRYILALSRDAHTAEEVTQETFFRALASIDQFRGDCQLRVWLCQIARNQYLSLCRERKHRGELEQEPGDDGLECGFADRDAAKRLHRLLHDLPEPYKEVFSLRTFGELPFAQIGELFGKTESWARVTYFRARQKLRRDLMDQLDHDIVQDLLPLYHDGVCSDKSRAAVEEHLQTCEACRAALTAMDAPLPEVEKAADDAAVAVKKISGEWKRGKRRAHIIGVIVAVVVCAAAAVGIWTLTTWTCIPMDGGDYTLDVYRLKSGGVGVHWDFREGRETWYALTFREEADGLHYYLERPILRVELFDFDSNYNRGGDAMFESWSDDAMETEAIYFGLGEDAVLLWKEGEEVDLPAATAAQEEMWAIAELPPQEVPQE